MEILGDGNMPAQVLVIQSLPVARNTTTGLEALTMFGDTLTHTVDTSWETKNEDTDVLRDAVDELAELLAQDHVARLIKERKHGIVVRADARALGAVTALSTTYRRTARLTARAVCLAHDIAEGNERYAGCKITRADGTTELVGATLPKVTATSTLLARLELLRSTGNLGDSNH